MHVDVAELPIRMEWTSGHFQPQVWAKSKARQTYRTVEYGEIW